MCSGRLLDPLRERIRYLHDSLRTEETYVYWVRLFVRFHQLCHSADMKAPEVAQFPDWRVSERNVSASTPRQTLSALLIQSEKLLGIVSPWLTEIGRPSVHKRLPVVVPDGLGSGALSR